MNSHRRSTDQRRRQIAKTHKTMRKNMQKRDLNSKQPKTTINGGYGSKMLAPVIGKPLPTTNTIPVEKLQIKQKI
jgi:hypothetical protein